MSVRRPVLAVTMGDPSGIGPEVVLKALRKKEIFEVCVPVVIGDGAALGRARKMLPDAGELAPVKSLGEAKGAAGTVEYLDMGLLKDDSWNMGEVSAGAGDAAFRCVKKAIELAKNGEADAIVTAPINKEALRLAGHNFPGHTEILARFCGVEDFAMLLISGNLRVVHVTTHMSMRDACDAITKERVLTTIGLAKEALESIGVSGKIAVAGLNPHASEHGLFGFEEAHAIIPAVKAAAASGIDVEGPVPADTVFAKALGGVYAAVVAMYHDQGHIPVKLAGFKMDEKTGRFAEVGGINCTVGLPIIRTSVDHGTAFDAAGKGIANESSMIDAIEAAAVMAAGKLSNGR